MSHLKSGRFRGFGDSYYYIMAGFTIMMAARTVFTITLRKISGDITTSATANIENSIIAIILTYGTNIPDIPTNPQDRKIGENEP